MFPSPAVPMGELHITQWNCRKKDWLMSFLYLRRIKKITTSSPSNLKHWTAIKVPRDQTGLTLMIWIMCRTPLQSSAGTNVWPVVRRPPIPIQVTLSHGMNSPLNQDRKKGKDGMKTIEGGKWNIHAKLGKPTQYSKKHNAEATEGSFVSQSVFPAPPPPSPYVHLVSSCRAVIEWQDSVAAAASFLRQLCSSLCITKCPLCHSFLLQRVGFILPLSRTLPSSPLLSAVLSLVHSSVHLHSATRE